MSTLNTCCKLALLMVLAAPFSKAHADAHAINVPWTAGMEVGHGFDSANASIDNRGFALVPDTSEPEDLGPAVCTFERKFDLEVVDSLSEYKKKIGVTAEAEINAIVATATGTLSFAHSSIQSSSSVYLVLRDERVNCHYRLKNPQLKPEAEAELETSYATFRGRFGDRFLSTLSTGGNFYAVLEVKTRSGETREELKFNLKAKVLGVTVFSWGMQKAFEDVMDPLHETRISIKSNNSVYNVGVTREQLFQRYAEYLTKVSGPACSGKTRVDGFPNGPVGPGECEYKRASFEDYQQLTRRLAGGGVEWQTLAMDALAERLRDYADILTRAQQVENNLDAYAYPENDASRASRVHQLVLDAGAQVQVLQNKYDDCRQTHTDALPADDLTDCQVPSQLNLIPEMSLENSFPVQVDRYPETCKALKQKQPILRDGPVRLYWQGKRTQPIDVYCGAMSTSDPQTYLLLRQSSASTAHPGVNFARRIAAPDEAFSESRTITSVLAGLHVEFVDGKAVVLRQDSGFVSNFGGPIQDGSNQVRHADLFAPETCDANGVQHLANLSLQGTPWVVSPENVFGRTVPAGSEGDWTVSADRKQLDAYGEGRTGCVELFVNDSLTLEYQP